MVSLIADSSNPDEPYCRIFSMQTEAKSESLDSHRWVIFAVICSVYILVYFHRVSTSVIATDLLAVFRTNAAALGFMSSMYFYLYAVEQPLVGYLSDRLGPRRVVVFWSLIAALGCVVFGLAPSIGWASVGRALIGFGVGGVYVPGLKAISQWFSRKDLGTMTGMLIVFEGLEQSGKETQARLLRQWFESAGRQVESLAFPDYATPIGQEIWKGLHGEREFGPDTIQLLLIANRHEWKPKIQEWLAAGRVVICDRYLASSVAYGEAQGLDPHWLLGVQAYLPQPLSPAEIDTIVALLAETDARFRMGKADLHPLMLQMAVHYITRNGGRGAWREFAA